MNLEPLRELISRLHNLKCDVLTKETGASLCNTPQIASNNYIHFIFFYIISSSSWVFPDFSPFFFHHSRKPPGFGGSGGGRGRGSGPLRLRLPRRGQCPGGVHRGAVAAADGGGWRLWLRVASCGT